MEDRYRNKYRISSARLSGWDYGSNGTYYVTICTKDRGKYFGEIENKRISATESRAALRATEIGNLAFNNWQNIPTFHPYVELDDFIIMPDHIHGVLFIDKPEKTDWEVNKFGVQSKNLASILRGFKASIKTYATTNNIEFCWQPRYYDRIVRSEKEYHNVKGYIKENPDQWFLDKNDFDNLFRP